MSVLETNVDDMDPRVRPTVLASLLEAGAADAWLVPIVMKKGRPAHTLAVLTARSRRAALRQLIFELTSTIGVREVPVTRIALDRFWVPLPVTGGRVRIKVAHRDGEIRMPHRSSTMRRRSPRNDPSRSAGCWRKPWPPQSTKVWCRKASPGALA